MEQLLVPGLPISIHIQGMSAGYQHTLNTADVYGRNNSQHEGSASVLRIQGIYRRLGIVSLEQTVYVEEVDEFLDFGVTIF